jgi:tRNA(His) 5'-end guanylyltransferase
MEAVVFCGIQATGKSSFTASDFLAREAGFDVRFRDMMVATTEHLMSCGFASSLATPRATRSRCSSIATRLRSAARRVSTIPSSPAKRAPCSRSRYFRWRNEDAHRNALNAHCYWALRKNGAKPKQASQPLLRLSVAEKNELLFTRAINFNDVPNWQKRGVGLYWEDYEEPALNPKTGETLTTTRRRIKRDLELPMRDDYGAFVLGLVAQATPQGAGFSTNG